MLHEQLSRDILDAAMAVLNELKPGLDEKLYENALIIELTARGHAVEQQREFPVHFRGHFIGKLVPDLIVDGKVIADPKVVTAFSDSHVAQMIGYLNITGLDLAVLLNLRKPASRGNALSKNTIEKKKPRMTPIDSASHNSSEYTPSERRNRGLRGWARIKRHFIRDIREIRGSMQADCGVASISR